jgi:hypothetical protein
MTQKDLNLKSERIPRRFCLTAVVLPVGSASAAQAAGLASESENGQLPYGRRFPAACCGELQTAVVSL